MIVKPAPDRRVRREDGSVLVDATEVDPSPYWIRRLSDGDVEIAAKKDAAK